MKNKKHSAKDILDRWATVVVPKEAVYTDWRMNAGIDRKKEIHYDKEGYKKDYVLWIAPKDCLRIEFEDTEENNLRYIMEIESSAKSLVLDYCITYHKGGKSPYFNIFNIKGMPLNEDNKAAKLLLVDMLLPASAKNQLDRTNLGWTLSPVIGHSHWKPKYKGAVHEIVSGKNPLEHENEYPAELLKQLKKSKTWHKKHIVDIKQNNKWVEDFLLNYCCSVKLPEGERHFVIEKNLAAFIIHRPDKEEIKEKYYTTQGRTGDTLRTWETSILKGDYTYVSAGELFKYIERHSLDYDVPFEKEEEFEDSIGVFTDFLDMAQRFIKKHPIFYDKSKMWWLWNHTLKCWEIIDETDILNKIDEALKGPGTDTVNTKTKQEIIESLKRIGRKNTPTAAKRTWVQFKDKIIDVETKEEITASPKYLITNPIPWDIGESEDTPTINKIFNEWVGEKYVDTLYEIIAYSLLPDYPLHRCFVLIGAGLNGKTKFLELITKFVGKNNTCSTELDLIMKSRFEITKLYKKLLCVMGETNFNTFSRTSILKRLIGGDVIGFEFKNKTPFDDYNYAKIIIATNTLPITLDKTVGFYRRWMIIDFPNTFNEKKDILEDIPEEEFNNLSRKSISLIKILLEKREFTNEGSVEDRQKRYEKHSNPFGMFIDDKCIKGVNEKIMFSDFYDNFLIFLQERKHRIMNSKEVSNLIKNEGFETKKENIKTDEGNNTKATFILGISIKNTKNRPHSTNSTYDTTQLSIEGANTLMSTISAIGSKHSWKAIDLTFTPCTICGIKRCEWENRAGKPYCEYCKGQINEKTPEEEVVK